MKDLAVEDLKKEELLSLRGEIDKQLERLNRKTKLSDLKKKDSILCINFDGSSVHHIDVVKITISEVVKEGMESYKSYSTHHDTKPLGCSSYLHVENLDNHCFLDIYPSGMYFFTLKPESWKDDIIEEVAFNIKLLTDSHLNQMTEFRNKIKELICYKEKYINSSI